jgi:hypothetical protein
MERGELAQFHGKGQETLEKLSSIRSDYLHLTVPLDGEERWWLNPQPRYGLHRTIWLWTGRENYVLDGTHRMIALACMYAAGEQPGRSAIKVIHFSAEK